jgi:AraC-like DNA-binding protein
MLDKEVLPNTNLVDYSVVSEFRSPSSYQNFSIKYVVDGTEMYYANGNKYFVSSKEYFIANKHCEGYVEIESRKPVAGICIELSPELLSEVVAGHLRPDTSFPDLTLDRFFNTDSFLENKYSASKTFLGKFLLELDALITTRSAGNVQFNNDFYFSLAEKIVEDYIPLFKNLQQVKSVKRDTKKDLLRKLLEAKNNLENCFYAPITIREISKNVGMSEYHFFRLFKTVFGETPHQYLILQRLNYAKRELERESQSISFLALETGFNDVHAFSKSFKKHFGFSPSQLLKK